MEAFESEGIFWPADEPARQVAGRLTFKPTDGASLDLFGAFDDIQQAFSGRGPTRRILGVAGAKDVTLDGCVPQAANFQSPGILRQVYYVPVVLTGTQFEPAEALAFDKVTVSFDHLPFWINRDNFSSTFESTVPNDFSTVTKTTVVAEIPEKESARTDEIEVELGYTSSVGGERFTEMHISQRPDLSLRFSERRALLDIIADIGGLQDLITLGIGAPAVPTEIVLRRSDFTRELSDGRVLSCRLMRTGRFSLNTCGQPSLPTGKCSLAAARPEEYRRS